MKIKIFSIGMLLLFIGATFIGTGEVSKVESNNGLEKIDINIAILTKERAWDCRDIEFFMEMFPDYQWIVGNKQYTFVVETLDDDEILAGKLNTDNFDAIIVPGASVGDAENMIRWVPTLKNKRWKNAIDDFVKAGGGYFGECGGAMLLSNFGGKAKSIEERIFKINKFDATCTQFYYSSCTNPLTGELFLPPDYVGELAYSLYTGWNLTNFNADHRGGICQDYKINRSHPIFDDYLQNTRRIRWIGGPALIVPEQPDRDISVLAWYPEEEMCDNESTKMYVWDYVGGIRGMIKGIFKSYQEREFTEFSSPIYGAYTHAADWVKTDRVMKTNLSNRPAITAEIYPNENEGRVVLSGPHTERNVWWGGEYKEVEDHENNNLFEGFYKWVNITDNPLEYEWTYNFWLNRRCVAWTAKVPDNDLPPVYGPSQACDFEDDVDSEVFTIMGNSESSEGIPSLDLYYRYSENNTEYGNWVLYETDSDESDGWSWEFNSPNGTGYYQFYSIRNVEYKGYTETETMPPGADATVYAEVD